MRQLTLSIGNPQIDELLEARARLEDGWYSRNTAKGYAHDWKMFSAWCARVERTALPASVETVALYLTDLLGQKRRIATAIRRTSSITHMHESSGFQTPIKAEIWRLISSAKRNLKEQPRQVDPITVEHLRAISESYLRDGTPEAIRNRGIMLLGFASALRRCNIAGLTVADINFVPEGLTIYLAREKQDQEGRGRFIGVPFGKSGITCPVESVRSWLDVRGKQAGPLFTGFDRGRPAGKFLSGVTIARVVKLAVARIGLDPARYGGHSLRAGFITEAAYANVSEFVIAAHTGHRSMDVLRKYFRRTHLFRSNAAGMIGL